MGLFYPARFGDKRRLEESFAAVCNDEGWSTLETGSHMTASGLICHGGSSSNETVTITSLSAFPTPPWWRSSSMS